MERDTILKQLEQQLQTSERVAISTLTGMGGIGKTELALQYALQDTDKPLQIRRYQGGICWLNAQGESNIGIQLLRFVIEYLQISMPDEGTLEERVAIGWQRWREGETLIIFDDVQEIKQIEPYLPPQENRFKVIITTRNQRISRNFALLPVELLSLEASLELLASLIGENRVNQDKTTAEVLCQWLGHLPLGIELVGRYIRETEEDLATVFKSLKTLKLADESLDYPNDEIMTAKRGVAAAFELSWQQLSKTAQVLAMSLSLFALAPIPAEMFLQEDNNLRQTQKNLRDLRNLSLIKDIGDKIYEFHPLIWHYLQGKLAESAEADNLKQHHCKLMAVIAQKIPEVPTQVEIKAFNPAIPHLALTAEELHPWLTDDELIRPYMALNIFYQWQGSYRQAEAYIDDCLRLTQNRLDAESLYVLLVFNNQADLYKSQGRYEEAETILREVWAKIEREENRFASVVANNLAELYKAQSRYEEAEPLLLKALELTEKILGKDHQDMAIRLDNLAELYRCQGRYEKAEPFALQAFDLRKKLVGMEHPYITNSLNNLGNLYLNQGKYEKAEDFYLQSVELSKKVFGEEHHETIFIFSNLATLYQIKGEYKEAEKLSLHSLNLSKKIWGEEHPNIANILNGIGLLYKLQGSYKKAEEFYIQALQIRQKSFGKEHLDVASSLNNLASLYEAQKRFEEAELLHYEALEIKKKRLGAEHPSVVASLNNLAVLYDNQGKYQAAESFYRQALEMAQKLLGKEHPDVATCFNNLAFLYSKQKKYAEAEPLYLQALEMRQKLLGKEHPDVATSLNNLALLYESQGKCNSAISYLEESIEIFQKSLGENHTNTTKVINNYLRIKQSLKTSNTNSRIRKSKPRKKTPKKAKGFGS